MTIKLQPGDYFEVAKLTNEQYNKVCQAMLHAGAKDFGNINKRRKYILFDAIDNELWTSYDYAGDYSGAKRLLSYADVFCDDEIDAHNYSDSTTDELIHEIRRMREEVRRRCLGPHSNA